MKRTFFFIFWLIGLNAALAQTNTAIQAPENTPNATLPTSPALDSKFNSDFPNNNPTWTSEGAYFRADFTDQQNNTGRYVTYDNDGSEINRGAVAVQNQYPSAIDNYYVKTYPNEPYKVWTREDKKNGKTYYVNRTYDVVWFDGNGNYVQTTKIKSKTTKTKPQPIKNKP